jgi:membrane-associated phospholipid phosphatase
MRKIAVITSAIMHPLMMPLLAVFIAFKFDWYLSGILVNDQENIIFLIIAMSTIAFPGLNILLLKWYGVVSSLSMPIRKERSAPFVSTLFFFCLGYYLLRKGSLPTPLYSIYLGCSLVLLILILINLKWKISVHAAGSAGVVGSTIGLFQIHDFSNLWLISILIVLTGLTLSSRLILKAHTPAQVYVGAVIGFATTYSAVTSEWVI